MNGKLKLSGAQERKHKAKEEEEAIKLRKTMAAFITVNRRNDLSGNDDEPNQPIMSTTAAAEENDVRDYDFTHSSENESEEEQTVNKAAVEDDCPEQAAVVTAATEEDDPVFIHKDVGYINFSTLASYLWKLWSDKVTTASRMQMQTLQRRNWKQSHCERGMTQKWIVKQLKNGIVVPRTWLMYLPRKEAAFCFCCLLFPSSSLNSRSSFELEAGFNSWEKMDKLKNHEKKFLPQTIICRVERNGAQDEDAWHDWRGRFIK